MNMKLNDREKEFIKGVANIMRDVDVAAALTRLRREFGVEDRVTVDQIRKARYAMGIQKAQGRGRFYIKRNKNDEQE